MEGMGEWEVMEGGGDERAREEARRGMERF